MLKNKLLKFTQFHLRVQGLLGTCPLKCEPNKTPSVTETESVAWESKKTKICMFYCFLLWLQLLKARKKEQMETQLESLYYAIEFSFACLIKQEVMKQRKSIAALLNMMLAFETRHLRSKYSYRLHTFYFN